MTDVMLSGRIPERLKRLVDADSRDNQEILRKSLKREFGSDEGSRLEMRLQHRREQKRMLEREQQEIQSEIASLDDEIGALEEQIEALEAESTRYEDSLDEILDTMTETGMHVDPGHGKVEPLEIESGKDPETVIEDLKERAEERDLGLPDRRFEEKGGIR